MAKEPCIYIMTNTRNGTLYTGVTSNLMRRVYEHKSEQFPGFTQKYNCKILVYYEQFEDMLSAIAREKRIKRFSRLQKIALIESFNPKWDDLYCS
jgi:predicted GIY-YIG superfamily endonuclease